MENIKKIIIYRKDFLYLLFLLYKFKNIKSKKFKSLYILYNNNLLL